MPKSEHRKRSGFTLIELLTVIAIIGILAGLILGISSVANRKAALGKAKSDMESLKLGLDEYRIKYGVYPPNGSTSGFDSVVQEFLTNYNPRIVFGDPWGNDYQYDQATTGFEYKLWSRGQDGTDGGGDDIDNWSGRN